MNQPAVAPCGCALLNTSPPVLCPELQRLWDAALDQRGDGPAREAFMAHFSAAVDAARAQRSETR